MELFVSAGEASSDIHCAHLLRELKNILKADGRELESFGLGGDALEAAGTKLLMHNREFSVGGGPVEILSRIPRRSQLERMLEKRLFDKRPDGAILVDNGEINLRLASLLHFFGVPIVYFIPPKVWVWRSSRIEAIAQHVNLVLSILPFEKPLYDAWEIPFQYVGNPLLDEVPSGVSFDKSRARLGLNGDETALAVFPGSRHSEIKNHVEIFSEAVRRMVETMEHGEKRPTVVVPVAQAVDRDSLQSAFDARLSQAGVRTICIKGESSEAGAKWPVSWDVLAASRCGLVKSGTSTLEAALVGMPMVLAYYVSRSSELIFDHIVRYRGFVGLVNLFLARDAQVALGYLSPPEKPVVPEVILSKCTPANIAAELLRIYRDGPDRETMLTALRQTREKLLPPAELGRSPIQAAARAAMTILRGGVKR